MLVHRVWHFSNLLCAYTLCTHSYCKIHECSLKSQLWADNLGCFQNSMWLNFVEYPVANYPWSRGYFFLIDTDGSWRSQVNEEKNNLWSQSMQPHFHVRNQFRIWTGSPIGYSHVKLFDVANQGHYYIVNSLRTWEYPIGDPVQILNWFLTWKWGCLLLWPEVIFFLVNPASLRTISIDKKKISSGTQGTSATGWYQKGACIKLRLHGKKIQNLNITSKLCARGFKIV